MASKCQLILTGLMVVFTYAISPAAAGCDTSELIPCLPAARSNPQPPSGQCCSLIHAITPECLCAALQSNIARIEGVDINTALQLPHKCGRTLPKGTKCGDVNVPTGIASEINHHEAMEKTMDHYEHSMDHGTEHQKTTEGSMKHHEEQGTKENYGMEHTMKPEMEDGMEH
ncbi:hypothetical protein R1flu_017553 [Riccia fluitans]|uniref:Bifunctional inhibitor/plant lipid transfer protein/seed storage helical domain-containing protein n=1 Tax=Riccia fluitans TaxID=41844 RepID=A0ABD1ZD99_9MARC